jgi:predicted Fe-Mo cluster-binding NifX family protein
MGKRALSALNRANVDVYVSTEDEVEKIVESAREKRLDLLTPRDASEDSTKSDARRRGRRGEGHWRDHGHDLVRGREARGSGPGHRPRQFRRSN